MATCRRELTWPMHMWAAIAAGGTSQRLKPGGAIVRSRLRRFMNYFALAGLAALASAAPSLRVGALASSEISNPIQWPFMA